MEKKTPAVVSPTNSEVGDKLGLTHSGVSRIRSGKRLPSIDRMNHIAEAYNWDIESQMQARADGVYAAGFEEAITGGFLK